jgi:hypothetical protein
VPDIVQLAGFRTPGIHEFIPVIQFDLYKKSCKILFAALTWNIRSETEETISNLYGTPIRSWVFMVASLYQAKV